MKIALFILLALTFWLFWETSKLFMKSLKLLQDLLKMYEEKDKNKDLTKKLEEQMTLEKVRKLLIKWKK